MKWIIKKIAYWITTSEIKRQLIDEYNRTHNLTVSLNGRCCYDISLHALDKYGTTSGRNMIELVVNGNKITICITYP